MSSAISIFCPAGIRPGVDAGKEFLSAGHQVENRLVAHQFRHVDLGFEDGRVNAGGHVLPRVDILRPYSHDLAALVDREDSLPRLRHGQGNVTDLDSQPILATNYGSRKKFMLRDCQ